MRTWLLSGVPRSGTSLCCRLAGGLAGVVALNEPIGAELDGVAGQAEAVERIDRFLLEVRIRALVEGVAPSLQVDGRLDDAVVERVAGANGLRPRRATGGQIATGPVDAHFLLLVKHNALFAALLPELGARFRLLALVRNPVAVLASWATVDLPVARGRIPAGERFDPGLARRLDTQRGTLARRVAVLDWFFARYREHVPAHRILRYEDVAASGGGVLFRALGLRGDRVAEPLADRNANPAYGAAHRADVRAALDACGGAWGDFYAPAELDAAAAALSRTARATGGLG